MSELNKSVSTVSMQQTTVAALKFDLGLFDYTVWWYNLLTSLNCNSCTEKKLKCTKKKSHVPESVTHKVMYQIKIRQAFGKKNLNSD